MQIAKVVGTAVSTVKHESLVGTKMMIVQPLGVDSAADGFPFVAIDGVGCGVGQTVMLTSDGRFGRTLLNHQHNPVRWTIVGIKD